MPTENAKPHAIVSGIEGDIWFTEWGSNQTGRITSCGEITEYQIPTIGAEPHGLVLGPDGAIWFAEESDKIGLDQLMSYTKCKDDLKEENIETSAGTVRNRMADFLKKVNESEGERVKKYADGDLCGEKEASVIFEEKEVFI